MLGALASLTSRVWIGTAVLLGSLRPPLLVAKAAASVDWLSGGRLILGLGVGSRPEDFAATETPIKQRGARMDELVQLLRPAWSGEPIVHHGRHHAFQLGAMRQLPTQRPGPPLWFGGRADAVFRRVALVGDGYIASTSSGVSGFSSGWRTIRAYAEEAGRDPSTITPAALIHFSLDSDRSRAEAAMREYLTQSYGPARAADLGNMVGTADDLRRGAEEYFAAGVEVLILSSVSADVAHLERFCDQVLPKLRAPT
jgi:probable F420-dependent oxidoreductase